MSRLTRDERGGILVLAAVMIPVFLLLTALVVDVGNWYTHKRQLQNKADAGALAAGVEYLSQLNNCRTNASARRATVISDVAKRYAGTGDPAIAGDEVQPDDQPRPADLTCASTRRARRPRTDDADGANPCATHATGDTFSPSGAIWTDVKVRETNIGTLFGGFGLDLLSAEAQARVEVKQILGIRENGLPFVDETGDQIECVWARVRACPRRRARRRLHGNRRRTRSCSPRRPTTRGLRMSRTST